MFTECTGVAELLSRIGDKWVVQVVVILSEDPERFNGIKRKVPGISQQMLARTLKALERDGLVNRLVRDTSPPQTEYSLTPLGHSLSAQVRLLAEWAVAHRAAIRDSRERYDDRHQSE